MHFTILVILRYHFGIYLHISSSSDKHLRKWSDIYPDISHIQNAQITEDGIKLRTGDGNFELF